VELCWQVEAETIAEDSGDEIKEDGLLENRSKMSNTEGDVRMQRRRERKHACTIWRIAMQSNQDC
jgi:hypothetical protein